MQRRISKVNLSRDSLKSPHTKDVYAYHIKEFLGTNPDPKTLDDAALTDHIEGYLKGMIESGLHSNYCKQAFYAIKHHYKYRPNKRLLDWDEIKSLLGEENHTGK